MGVGCGPAFKRPPPIYFWGFIHRPETVIFLEMGILDAEPRNRPKRAPQQAQGTGHMCAEQNAPKIAPKHPGVGFRHAVTRSAQSVHTACTGLSATKRTTLMAWEVIY